MTLQRSDVLDVDGDFQYNGEVTKSWVDPDSGARFVRGVASGIEVDRDGERVSKKAIASLAAQINTGGVKLVGGTHQQDWSTEMGDVVKGVHDPDHDQLLIEARFPPEGEDSLADKAWTRMTKHGEKLAFSIGGKLRKAYFEIGDLGKRVKVLDDIMLRHVALTKNASYSPSFAEAVAKTFTADPESLTFHDAADDDDVVAKGGDAAPAADGKDSVPGDRNAGANKDGNKKNVDGDEADDEDTGKEPEAVRHLACPNCGHEFAAPIPDGADETNPTQDLATGKDNDKANKTAMESNDMDTLTQLARLVADDGANEPVAKTEPTPPAPVEKTEPLSDTDQVLKMLAASHRANTEGLDAFKTQVNEVLETVAKAVVSLSERVGSMPVGRKSIARILPPNDGAVTKTVTDDDNNVEKQIDEAPDALTALRIANKATYGIE